MIPHLCTIRHDPPNSYGDCLRACIASLINAVDSKDVPHFCRDMDDERAAKEMKEYLQSVGLRPFYMALAGGDLESVLKMMAGINTDIEYLLFCKSGGVDHVVICCNDKVIHDPAWYKCPIDGPTSNGMWVIVVVVPIDA